MTTTTTSTTTSDQKIKVVDSVGNNSCATGMTTIAKRKNKSIPYIDQHDNFRL